MATQGDGDAHMSIQLGAVREKHQVSLQQAARDGREDILCNWLADLPKYHGAALLNERDSEGFTALHYAARFNRFKIMQLLVTDGADPYVTTDDKLTPLHFAARYLPRYQDEATLQEERLASLENLAVTNLSSSRRAMQFLVEDCGVDPNCKDQHGVSPLHLACGRGNIAAVEVLLKSPNTQVDIQDNSLDTPLHEACLTGDIQIVKILLQRMQGDNIGLLAQNAERQTPLHFACREGYVEIVKLILQFGFQQLSELVSAQDNEYNTPLHLACESGDDKNVRVLLLNGADTHAVKNSEISSLHIAARHGFISVAKTLLESGMNIDCEDADQRTPLHYAAEHNQVKMIEFLLEKGVDIEALDKNSYTPLLTAASCGQTDAFRTLLDQKATIDAVDKYGKSSVFLAAKEDHCSILRIMVEHPIGAKLCRTSDFNHNTPLHVAAAKGSLGALKVLLTADIKIDARNELSKTPMHLAAECGNVPIVRELIRHQRDTIEDEDENSNTPLHLACTNGHLGVAMVLINADTDVMARNSTLRTPMHCAASGGWDQLVLLLINARAEIDPTDKSKLTSLHLACREGHLKVVDILLKHGAYVTNADLTNSNALDLAIENGHKEVAMTIIKSPKWKNALRNVTESPRGGMTTPLRKLIKKMPEVAEEVFNKCTLTNATKDGQIHPDSKDYSVTFNYEFLEDFQDAEPVTGKVARALTHMYGSVTDDNLKAEIESVVSRPPHTKWLAPGYTTNWGPKGFTKSSHPLSIMVDSVRIDLLKHPLVTSLLDYKWNNYVRYFYLGNLIFYIMYLVFLTTFALVVLNPQSATCEAIFNNAFGNNDTSLDVSDPLFDSIRSGDCNAELSESREGFLYVAAVITIIFAVIRITMELLQFLQLRRKYIVDWVNWVELSLFSFSITFVSVFGTECLCPRNWQWQFGTIAIFLSWINLIIFIRKLPFLGIYVVMFVDIFYTFLKMIILSFLLIIAFGLAFYMALFEPQLTRTPFSTPARSFLKTVTMTTGEFEFDDIFRLMSGGDPLNQEEIPFPPVSYILWIVFIILMPILLTNLLVGLAVDDIKGVQQQAVLKRLALQVELALNVEELFPKRLRRWFIIGEKEVLPNRALNPFENFRYSVWGGQRFDSAENISNALNPPLDPIEHGQHQTRTDVDKMKKTVAELNERIQFMETILRMIAEKQGISTTDPSDATWI